MPAIRLPAPEGNLSSQPVEKQVQALTDLVMRFRRELEYLLNGNLDEDNGVIKADAAYIEQIFAEYITTNVLESNTVIVNNLTAQKGYIARLTVDSIDSSDKVQNYLASDKSIIGYFRGANQHIQFIEAEYVGDVEGVAQTEQATDNGTPLYWLDAEQIGTGITIDITDYPIMQYQYTEYIKTEIFHRLDTATGHYNPVIRQGAGNGVGDNGKFEMEKKADGWYATYIATGAGELDAGAHVSIALTNDGVFITPYDLESISFGASGFDVTYSGHTYSWGWTKDGAGKITQLQIDGRTIPVTWT